MNNFSIDDSLYNDIDIDIDYPLAIVHSIFCNPASKNKSNFSSISKLNSSSGYIDTFSKNQMIVSNNSNNVENNTSDANFYNLDKKRNESNDSSSSFIGALKEWAIVCKALEDGKQVLLFRKGGIMEFRNGFELKYKNFLLFPTFEHQSKESIKKKYYDELEKLEHDYEKDGLTTAINTLPSNDSSNSLSKKQSKYNSTFVSGKENITTISSFVEITYFTEISKINDLEKLQEFHIWNLDYVKKRFNYNPKKPLYLMLLRTYKLNNEIKIVNKPEWAGCKSWIQIDSKDQAFKKYLDSQSTSKYSQSQDIFDYLKSISKPCIDDIVFNEIAKKVRSIA